MTATVIFTPEQPNDINHTDYAQVMVHVDAKIVSATRVRRKANGWLIMEVGERVMAGEPELLIGTPLVWRLPIHWTSSKVGILKHNICSLLVDAISGDILEPETKITEILYNVQSAARALQPTTA